MKSVEINGGSQLELLEEIQSKGFNIVNCGNCGSTLLHKCSTISLEDYKDGDYDIKCCYCGFQSEPCDFPDFHYQELEEEINHVLLPSNVELILEEVFLDEDETETDPVNVFCIGETKRPRIFTQNTNGKVVEYKLLVDQDVISKELRDEILKYRLGKVTAEDEVSLGDIFMYGKFVEKI